MKLRITIDGKTYEAEVEILEDEESEHPYVPYTPAPVSYTPPPVSFTPAPAPLAAMENDSKECRSPVTGLVIAVNVGAIVCLLWRLRRDKHWPWHHAA